MKMNIGSNRNVGFDEQYHALTVDNPPDGFGKGGVYVRFVGESSPTRPERGYGHLGAYKNQVKVIELLDMSLEDKCPQSAAAMIEPDDNILISTGEVEGVIFVDGDWLPTIEDIQTLEEQLGPFLSQHQAAFNGSKPPIEERLPTYKRQYWGVFKDKKRAIFANFFCDSMDKDWAHHEIIVVDGGDCFFQIYYNVETETFFDLYVNGEA
jgi:hypothetical protein